MAFCCGHCKNYHDTVDEVRACSAAHRVDPEFKALLEKSSVGQAVAKMRTKFEPAAEGLYVKDGTIYKVVAAKLATGRRYAKALMSPDSANEKRQWVFASGVVMNLKPEHKMTAEQAAQYGKLYGCCVNCASPLTHEESIDRGYGPDCADRFGWPYDHSRRNKTLRSTG